MLRALKPQPARSPAREALAAAIAYHAKRQAEITGANKALENATAAYRAARDARDAAARAVEETRDAATAFLIAKANGTEGAAPLSIHEARTNLDRAENDLASAKEAMDLLESKANSLQRYGDIPAQKVTEAVAAVMRDEPAAQALVADVERLQRELAEKGAALLFLASERAVHLDNVQTSRGSEFSPARTATIRMQQPPSSWPALANYPNLPSIMPWRAAIAALRQDASADLPKL
jgi:chromosome segregation ATPase